VASGLSFREATVDDALVMAQTVDACFQGYRDFAPEGWEPPPVAIEVTTTRARLASAGAWALLAYDDGRPAGQVALLPDPAPATAYLWELFVLPDHWGSGLGQELHDRFLAAARSRRYEHGRLLTPEGQARARRFYERNGWRTDGVAAFEERLGMPIMAYTRVGLT
jgi:GNAT superfamily N-acetyltransferase